MSTYQIINADNDNEIVCRCGNKSWARKHARQLTERTGLRHEVVVEEPLQLAAPCSNPNPFRGAR